MMRSRTIRICGVLHAALAIGILTIPAHAGADSDDDGPDLDTADLIGSSLEPYEGKHITLRLSSGAEVEGTCEEVGRSGVRISHIVGKDSVEAIFRLDRIDGFYGRASGSAKPTDAKSAKE